jgi:hypothetical protein
MVMTRFVRYSLFALVLVALSSPMFAFCTSCGDDSACYWTPDSGTRCIEHFDYCEEYYSGCTGVAGESTLSDQLVVASIEVATPSGVTKSNDTPRVAEQKALPNPAVAFSTR